LVLGHDAGARIEHAHVGGAVARIPDIALRIAGHIMRREEYTRQLVFSHYDPRRGAARSRIDPQLPEFRTRRANPRQPFHDHFLLLAITPRGRTVDERGAGMVHHAEHHQAPAAFVELVSENLLIGMAAVAAIAAEGVFLLGRARKIP